MTTPPPIYIGPGSPERNSAAAAAVRARAQTKATLKAIAEQFGVTRRTLHRMCQAAGSSRYYEVQLTREGSTTMRVCTICTPKGAMAAAVAAYREYTGTLKGLELPGWQLLVGDTRFKLEEVRAAASPTGNQPSSQGASFAKKYGSLTNATRRAG